MDVWYRLIDILIPLDWTGHIFMKNALLAVLLVTPVFGILGTMVVSNKMAFFSDSIGHSALTGVAIGVVMGIHNPLWSMVLFSIVLSILISLVKSKVAASMDTIIGVFSSTVIALGIFILSRNGGFARYSGYMVGDLLSITSSDLLLLFIVLAAVMVFWIMFYNKLLVVSINHSIAASRGMNVRLLETVFTVIVAVVVTISIQWIGILIINSMLVIPAAAARNITGSARGYQATAVTISVIAGVSGLILSYYFGTATGATIILVSSVFYILSLILRSRFH